MTKLWEYVQLLAFLVLAALIVIALFFRDDIHNSHPLGERLQREAGDKYEVMYNPRTKAYVVEPSNEASPFYVCHTFSTWNERDYAEFTVERDGQTIACLRSGGKR